MALAAGSGPFGPKSNGEFNFDTSVLQAHTLYFEDCPKRVRAEIKDYPCFYPEKARTEVDGEKI